MNSWQEPATALFLPSVFSECDEVCLCSERLLKGGDCVPFVLFKSRVVKHQSKHPIGFMYKTMIGLGFEALSYQF